MARDGGARLHFPFCAFPSADRGTCHLAPRTSTSVIRGRRSSIRAIRITNQSIFQLCSLSFPRPDLCVVDGQWVPTYSRPALGLLLEVCSQGPPTYYVQVCT